MCLAQVPKKAGYVIRVGRYSGSGLSAQISGNLSWTLVTGPESFHCHSIAVYNIVIASLYIRYLFLLTLICPDSRTTGLKYHLQSKFLLASKKNRIESSFAYLDRNMYSSVYPGFFFPIKFPVFLVVFFQDVLRYQMVFRQSQKKIKYLLFLGKQASHGIIEMRSNAVQKKLVF